MRRLLPSVTLRNKECGTDSVPDANCSLGGAPGFTRVSVAWPRPRAIDAVSAVRKAPTNFDPHVRKRVRSRKSTAFHDFDRPGRGGRTDAAAPPGAPGLRLL